MNQQKRREAEKKEIEFLKKATIKDLVKISFKGKPKSKITFHPENLEKFREMLIKK